MRTRLISNLLAMSNLFLLQCKITQISTPLWLSFLAVIPEFDFVWQGDYCTERKTTRQIYNMSLSITIYKCMKIGNLYSRLSICCYGILYLILYLYFVSIYHNIIHLLCSKVHTIIYHIYLSYPITHLSLLYYLSYLYLYSIYLSPLSVVMHLHNVMTLYLSIHPVIL